jgi:predicted ATPase
MLTESVVLALIGGAAGVLVAMLAVPLLSHLVPTTLPLAEAPHVKLIVTSREPLHLSWEHVWPVPPLALPPATDTADRDAIAASPAVALFVERAQAVQPTFALTDENARTVADICVRMGC